ncbi:14518_t:CDS:2 [Acaulospora colombiana]|uniref:14518_t:CDS:1 n=1 Tax=Acaulospora colombiana TaxID=27376 RepID=A0ACA9MEE2_9GLOM|nr:14518_t:CDS:2 [Acaulospora colombiana]
MPPRVKVNFHYDIGSSYSYFAYEILLRYEKLWNIDLQLTPILLGGLVICLTITNHLYVTIVDTLISVGIEQGYTESITGNTSHGPEFPGNTFMVMRMLRYLKDILPPEKFKAATRHYFRENFVVNTALSSPSFITSLSPSILSPEEMKDALIKFKDKSVTDAMKAEAAALVQDFGAYIPGLGHSTQTLTTTTPLNKMPPRVKINFHYDIGSSYSYIAYEILLRYEKLWNVDLQLTPILLGGVFQLTGNTSPAASAYKAAHMLNDLRRVSAETQGPEFPGNTFLVMRMLRYLKDVLPPEKFKAATTHYFVSNRACKFRLSSDIVIVMGSVVQRENFVVNTALSSPSFITSLPSSILSKQEMEEALLKFKDKSVSNAMKAESTALVQEYGAFGFPWIVVTRNPTAINPAADGDSTACFFGSDRFANIAWWCVLFSHILTHSPHSLLLYHETGSDQNTLGWDQYLPRLISELGIEISSETLIKDCETNLSMCQSYSIQFCENELQGLHIHIMRH